MSTVIPFPMDGVRIEQDAYLIPGYASLLRRGAIVCFGRTHTVLKRYQPGDVIRVCRCDYDAVKLAARSRK